MEERRRLLLARMSVVMLVWTKPSIVVERTGGFSSNCSPSVGFADKLANTPSLTGICGPLDCEVVGWNAGSSVTTLLATTGGLEALDGGTTGLPIGVEVSARINRCLSSPSFSASEASPSSNVSARLLSASCASSLWDVGDEALE